MESLFRLFLACVLVLASCNKDNAPIAVGSVSLSQTTLTLNVRQTATLTATVQPDNAHEKSVVWSSSKPAVATAGNNGLVTAVSLGTTTITATAGGKSATCTVTVKPGVLINGIVWATTNVDAPGTFAANPEDAGMFYQGNSKTGWSATDPMTSSPAGQKWGAAAPGDSWAAANDPCPEGWRVPTLEELKKLVGADNVGSEWTTRNGINGREFKDNSSGNTVFFPAVGYRTTNAELEEIGYFGEYWTSTIDNWIACNLYFDSTSAAADGISALFYAFSVRCVLKE